MVGKPPPAGFLPPRRAPRHQPDRGAAAGTCDRHVGGDILAGVVVRRAHGRVRLPMRERTANHRRYGCSRSAAPQCSSHPASVIVCRADVLPPTTTRVLFTATGESTRNRLRDTNARRTAAPGQTRGPEHEVHHRTGSGSHTSPSEQPTRCESCPPTVARSARWPQASLIFRARRGQPTSRRLLVVAHSGSVWVELDCSIVPLQSGAPLDTGVMKQGRQQGLISNSAVGGVGEADSSCWLGEHPEQGVPIWRQQVAPQTFDAVGTPEAMTPGGDYAFFRRRLRGRLSFVGTHADVNLWSVAIDATTGKAHGPLRRLTRGAGIVSHLTVSQDGRTLAHFGVSMSGGELHIKEYGERRRRERNKGKPSVNHGFPAISPSGQRLAIGNFSFFFFCPITWPFF